MSVRKAGIFTALALGMTALAGCITTNPPPPAPVVVQSPVPPGSIVVTPKAN